MGRYIPVKCWFDIESNSRNPYVAEPVEMYFVLEDGRDYHFKSRINNWCEKAAEIHKISESEMLSYPNKDTAFKNLLEWLPHDLDLIVFANYQSELGYLLYDEVLLKMSLLDHLELERIEHLPFRFSSKSVHSMAKEAHKRGLFEVITSGKAYNLGLLTDKKYIGSNRVSYRQSIVYYSLFGETYDAHNCVIDTKAMRRIYNTLEDLLESGKSIVEKNQMSLI